MKELFVAARQQGYVTLQDLEMFCDEEDMPVVLDKFAAVGCEILDFPEQEGVHAILMTTDDKWRSSLTSSRHSLPGAGSSPGSGEAKRIPLSF
jgi:hypothetical protein